MVVGEAPGLAEVGLILPYTTLDVQKYLPPTGSLVCGWLPKVGTYIHVDLHVFAFDASASAKSTGREESGYR